ncbi:GntR family transcriptional regulator [Breznakia sp. PF5-3]|uniref:GntR family transcriptional regulator n=1 Tax=unclassified Breznakia TaxID=2623764 RepID=UPI002404C720|nr:MULTISPECIES: GntR family transcriptional regulator [unclassified Breznakia]MDL2276406.1 GntR family transcriptional regulator [Breznakia sp. OttesenSCG-928-G09]MDF9823792.1 GntR family transcriptional regulator [Breznakia sp. PM6-1]MDF9834642.1 GntR family transcriptional regulator [Breznakia sp. PF5-3]MDF9836741.1 GntR family transcriptional regulator [Breznakia sp. PFB2-8]MDF9858810.1 GntR family transcriptional regulator [Breznakia sp. PH5-24]
MNNFDKLPVYYQVANKIEENIEKGIWKKGEPIPSERELIKIYSVSRITVRNAIDELVKKGKLEKIQGKGTYVLGKSIIQNLGNLYSFTREMEKQGKISTTKVLDVSIIKANTKIANQLGVKEEAEVIYIERLRCADEEPIMIERSYFSKDKYGFILDIDLNKKSLYKTLEDEYGVYINKAIETFSGCMLTEDESKKLGYGPNQYGLLVKRTSFSDEKVVCYSTTVASGDTFEFTIKLEI